MNERLLQEKTAPVFTWLYTGDTLVKLRNCPLRWMFCIVSAAQRHLTGLVAALLPLPANGRDKQVWLTSKMTVPSPEYSRDIFPEMKSYCINKRFD